jgi:endonuclease/exonuclease/phosphatase family metal-dependent hydrolase
MRIATYNIHRAVGLDGRCDVGRIARVISELGCDTVALQEVFSVPHGDAPHAMQLDQLAALTGMHRVGAATVVRDATEYGNALLTRRRVVAVERHDLSFRRREPRGALEVDLEVGGRLVRVIVTHLGLGAAERRHQARRLLQLIEAVPAARPLVLLGDLNEWWPLAGPLRWIDSLLGTAPARRSFPTRMPLFALDRIWVRPSHALRTLVVHRSALARRASDHFPVKATLALGARDEGGLEHAVAGDGTPESGLAADGQCRQRLDQ